MSAKTIMGDRTLEARGITLVYDTLAQMPAPENKNTAKSARSLDKIITPKPVGRGPRGM